MGNILIYIDIGLIIAGMAYKFRSLYWFDKLPDGIKYKFDMLSHYSD